MPVTIHEWDQFLCDYPQTHLLQTSTWGRLKSDFGWDAIPMIAGDCGAQVLFRKLPLGFHVGYLPKGPVGKGWERLWPEVDALCRKKRCVFLKVEPDLWEDEIGPESSSYKSSDFEVPANAIQPLRSLVVDLRGTEDQILARMKQKTRYNIRLAQRKGVVIREIQDVDSFYQLMELTAVRDAFGVHSRVYYERAFELFAPSGSCTLLQAEFEGMPLAGVMVFAQGPRAWYFYGASSNENRHLMSTYRLQWEAMRWAKAQGCTDYDLWGVPDADLDTLEANFMERNDGLWGVYRFKRGFGGELRRSVPAVDRVYKPLLYKLYLWRTRGGETD